MSTNENKAAPRNRWVRKLIDSGVNNLREFGYSSATAENITTDSVFAPLFANMLRENKGASADYDEAIDALLAEIEAAKAEGGTK